MPSYNNNNSGKNSNNNSNGDTMNNAKLKVTRAADDTVDEGDENIINDSSEQKKDK